MVRLKILSLTGLITYTTFYGNMLLRIILLTRNFRRQSYTRVGQTVRLLYVCECVYKYTNNRARILAAVTAGHVYYYRYYYENKYINRLLV